MSTIQFACDAKFVTLLPFRKGYNKSILKNQVFNESRIQRILQKQGIGKKKNASKVIDSGEEELSKAWQYFLHLSRQNNIVSMPSTFWSARFSGTHS